MALYWLEILGYLAAGACIVTLLLKLPVPVRMTAAGANAGFIAFGVFADVSNLWILHGWLLPLSIWRLHETNRLQTRLRHMERAAFDPQAFLSLMTRLEQPSGSSLFRKGEAARDIFYLLEGRVRVEELEMDIEPGQLIGEMAMFTPDKTRTQSVRCMEDCVFMKITEDRALEMYAENPEFGLYLTKMMVARLLSNVDQTPQPAIA